MEKFIEITYLFDFYQALLTDKQRELVSQYYFEDYSLGELAIEHNISRQSIFDTIRKAQNKLIDLESKLGLWKKYQKQQAIIQQLCEVSQQMQKSLEDKEKPFIKDMEVLLEQLMHEI